MGLDRGNSRVLLLVVVSVGVLILLLLSSTARPSHVKPGIFRELLISVLKLLGMELRLLSLVGIHSVGMLVLLRCHVGETILLAHGTTCLVSHALVALVDHVLTQTISLAISLRLLLSAVATSEKWLLNVSL